MERDCEIELVYRLRQGDAYAFDEVFKLFNRRLLSFLTRLAKSRSVAEELVEETWLRLVANAGSLHAETHIGPWLFAVARNLYVSYCRNRAREQTYTADLTLLWPSMPAISPFEAASTNELTERLELAIGALPPRYREVLLLVGMEQLNPADAAKICGITGDCLRQRLSRARQMLAAALQQDMAAAHDEVIR